MPRSFSSADKDKHPFRPVHRGGRRGAGRLLGHGDLRLLLLALIEQQPRHGYELIRLIGDMFHGHYVPSPGAVYPVLAQLEEIGLVRSEACEGGRKRYTVSDAGHDFAHANRDTLDGALARTARSARVAMKASLPSPVRQGMQQLKRALGGQSQEWDEDEVERVAGILLRAAHDIAGNGERD